MGPDLLGIAGATAFLFAVICVYALIDRLLCGAWEALNGSPGWGLVAGMTAWATGTEPREAVSPPESPTSEPPIPAEPVAAERVPPARIRGPMWFAVARAVPTRA